MFQHGKPACARVQVAVARNARAHRPCPAVATALGCLGLFSIGPLFRALQGDLLHSACGLEVGR
jgi:hypothetical protein